MEKTIFIKASTIYGHGYHLGHVVKTILVINVPSSQLCFVQNLDLISQAVSVENISKIVTIYMYTCIAPDLCGL